MIPRKTVVCSGCGLTTVPSRIRAHRLSSACAKNQAWVRGFSDGIQCAPAGEDDERADMRSTWRKGYADGSKKKVEMAREGRRGELKALQDDLKTAPHPLWSHMQKLGLIHR